MDILLSNNYTEPWRIPWQLLKSTKMENSIIGWGVYYAPTKEGKIFAGLKNELMGCFVNQIDAIKYCDELNQGGYLDDMRFGYVVYSLKWLPKGYRLRY